MGKDKSSDALKHLIGLCVEIVAVITPSRVDSELRNTANLFQLPVRSDVDIYEYLEGTKKTNLNLENIDMVISYTR